jgi:hypothetical protein
LSVEICNKFCLLNAAEMRENKECADENNADRQGNGNFVAARSQSQ